MTHTDPTGAALLAQCELLRDIARLMPKPELGEWNWPSIAAESLAFARLPAERRSQLLRGEM